MKLLPLAALAMLLSSGCVAPDEPSPTATPAPTAAPACGGHRHATFAVAVPGADGNVTVLDLASPRHANGHAYYQLGLAPGMDHAVHMHQAGPEAGNASLQATQMHYESSGACASVARSLAAIDVAATATSVQVGGRHNATGSWSVSASNPLAVHVQRARAESGRCVWTWSAMDAVAGLAHVVEDGESFVVVLGPASAGQVDALKASLPPPMARPRTC